MQSEIQQTGQELLRGRTFIEEARRAQIIKTTIEVLADIGYGRTSLAEIARRAGISKGVIHYHFHSKGELFEQVVTQTFKEGRDWQQSLLDGEGPASLKLKAYIAGNVRFLQDSPKHLRALIEIFRNHPRQADSPFFEDARTEASSLVFLEQLLQEGQRAGEFRPFVTRAVSAAIRAAVDVMPMRHATDPEFDLDAYGAELFELFWRALKADDAVLPEST